MACEICTIKPQALSILCLAGKTYPSLFRFQLKIYCAGSEYEQQKWFTKPRDRKVRGPEQQTPG